MPGNVDEKITATALHLLRANGPDAVTIEGVAAQSGVARTTVYRRFADRREMLTAALSTLTGSDDAPPPAGASGEQRLRWVIEHAAAIIFDGIGMGGFAALVTNADPAFTDLFRTLLRSHRAALADAVSAGVDDGVLRPIGDVETLVDSIVGTLIAEFARTGGIATGWVDRLFELYAPLTIQPRQ